MDRIVQVLFSRILLRLTPTMWNALKIAHWLRLRSSSGSACMLITLLYDTSRKTYEKLIETRAGRRRLSTAHWAGKVKFDVINAFNSVEWANMLSTHRQGYLNLILMAYLTDSASCSMRHWMARWKITLRIWEVTILGLDERGSCFWSAATFTDWVVTLLVKHVKMRYAGSSEV